MFRITKAKTLIFAASVSVAAVVTAAAYQTTPSAATTRLSIWQPPDTGVCQQHWDMNILAYTKMKIRAGATDAEIKYCEEYGDATKPFKMGDPNSKDGIAHLADGSFALFWKTAAGVVAANGPNAVHFGGPNGSPTANEIIGPPPTTVAPPPGVRAGPIDCGHDALTLAEVDICQNAGITPGQSGPPPWKASR